MLLNKEGAMRDLDYYIALGYKVINEVFGLGELKHHGIKGQKHGVRNGPPYPLDRKKSLEIQKSAKESDKNGETKKKKKVKWQDYDIRGPEPNSKEIFHLAEGTHIKNKQIFAGKGGDDPLNEETAIGLSEQIGGKPENWQHWKGDGVVDYYGEDRKADIHWFEEESVGRHKFKVKKWLED